MFWFILLSSCIAIHAQQGLLFDLHPAEPHILEESFLSGIKGNEFNNEFDDVAVDSLMDPEGKPIHEPLRAHAMVLEEELRKEAAEIQRVMADAEEASEMVDVRIETWLWTFLGCSFVASCGILPAFLLPANWYELLTSEEGKRQLNLVLSFGVGTLLADVCLHLMPETYENNDDPITAGLWFIAGALAFFFIERLGSSTEEGQHQICAYMNLAANIVDNFAHGLAVGSSFLISTKVGFTTTIAILLHELPHEVMDFAILLRADFDVWAAVKAQGVTASAGYLGAFAALLLHTSNVPVIGVLLPFTAGGFLSIALIQIVPELHKERSAWEHGRQLLLIWFGIFTMSKISSMSLF